MAEFKVLKDFKDVHTGEVYSEGDEIEMTVKRSKEVAKNLDDTYLERIEAGDTDGDD